MVSLQTFRSLHIRTYPLSIDDKYSFIDVTVWAVCYMNKRFKKCIVTHKTSAPFTY